MSNYLSDVIGPETQQLYDGVEVYDDDIWSDATLLELMAAILLVMKERLDKSL